MDTRYTYARQLALAPEQALQRVTEALAAEGFGVLTEIDVAATLKKKLDLEFRPYRILGACNPHLAYRAIQAEPSVGALLPCNVVLQQQGDGTLVEIARPDSMAELTGNPALRPVMEEADQRLRRVIAAL